MDPIELDIARRNTTAFIAVKPTVLRLIPVEREKTSAGGYRDIDQAPRVAQTFRIIEQGVTAGRNSSGVYASGETRRTDFMLLGEWNAQMEIGDKWTSTDGREWYVSDIIRDNLYEVRGLVVEHGK